MRSLAQDLWREHCLYPLAGIKVHCESSQNLKRNAQVILHPQIKICDIFMIIKHILYPTSHEQNYKKKKKKISMTAVQHTVQ